MAGASAAASGNPFGFSDAARRISDQLRQAIVDGHGDRFMAFALEDGRSDGKTYEQRRDAIRFHSNRARKYAYIKVPWDDCSPRAAEAYLMLHRQLDRLGQHPADNEMPDTEWMFDNRREAYPQLDRRRLLKPDPGATRSGLWVPGGK